MYLRNFNEKKKLKKKISTANLHYTRFMPWSGLILTDCIWKNEKKKDLTIICLSSFAPHGYLFERWEAHLLNYIYIYIYIYIYMCVCIYVCVCVCVCVCVLLCFLFPQWYNKIDWLINSKCISRTERPFYFQCVRYLYSLYIFNEHLTYSCFWILSLHTVI